MPETGSLAMCPVCKHGYASVQISMCAGPEWGCRRPGCKATIRKKAVCWAYVCWHGLEVLPPEGTMQYMADARS